MNPNNSKYVLVIHGGAGTIAPGTAQTEQPYHDGLQAALQAGQAILARGGTAMEAVVAAVVSMEDNALFNAGHGAVFNSDGQHELDACVMEGTTLRAGALAGVRTVRNPVLGALSVMQDGRFVLLGAQGAERFCLEQGIATVAPDYFSTTARLDQLRAVQSSTGMTLDHDGVAPRAQDANRYGTVGAVALDLHGHLAAATSTGGMTNKCPGRIGDSPIIGAGCYANDASCAVSTTGTGEHFIRACVAHDIHARMVYAKQSLADAADAVFSESIVPMGGSGGLVALDRDGNMSLPYNSTGMYRGWVGSQRRLTTCIFANPDSAKLT